MVATITRTRRKLFIIAVVIAAMLGAIPVVALAHNVTVPGGQDWTYLGYHYHNIGLAGFQFYGTVAQWTKDRTYEGINRWYSVTSKLGMGESIFFTNYVRENNNLSVRGLYQSFNLSG